MPTNNDLERRKFLALTASFLGGTLAGRGADAKAAGVVSLKDAHIGTLEIDLRIMNQYEVQPQEVQDFYTASRKAMTGSDPEGEVAKVCQKFNRRKLGGPMLGDPSSTGVSVWMHLPQADLVKIVVSSKEGGFLKSYQSGGKARIHSLRCEGLSPDTAYEYQVQGSDGGVLGKGSFLTVPEHLSEKPFNIAFGTCYHKVGMYRPELMKLVRERGNRAMLVLGDSAVDGRKDDYGLINADYLLRNLSPSWRNMTANVPVSATWDDHDYWGNDTSGKLTNRKKPIDVDGLRQSWQSQWNNPERGEDREGIYFQTKIGPVHYIALDTRSCRVNEERGKLNCFLGEAQMNWLKQQIKESTSSCILISGGTMWSDNISDGKDSWGTWDTEGREEIFQVIDAKKDSLVLLMSGDRHGARGIAIPRPKGGKIHELEVAGMGGVPGPGAFGKDRDQQLFGYPGGTWAFGELTFSKESDELQVVFRLVDENGKELETISLKR
ncbi:alkaline phosphatase D family protein [Haloferula sp.]|uniref:alkaline phosphatase D family protein n=1 Tax=Haloferula sp. TaxID=2497595 RepID=UPI00329BF5E6